MSSETSKTNEDGDVTNACSWKCLKCRKVNSKAVKRCKKPCYSYPGGRRGPNRKKKENNISSPSSKQESNVAEIQLPMAAPDPKQTAPDPKQTERLLSKEDPVPTSGPNKRNREESSGPNKRNREKIAASTANTKLVSGEEVQVPSTRVSPRTSKIAASTANTKSVSGEEVQVSSTRISFLV